MRCIHIQISEKSYFIDPLRKLSSYFIIRKNSIHSTLIFYFLVSPRIIPLWGTQIISNFTSESPWKSSYFSVQAVESLVGRDHDLIVFFYLRNCSFQTQWAAVFPFLRILYVSYAQKRSLLKVLMIQFFVSIFPWRAPLVLKVVGEGRELKSHDLYLHCVLGIKQSQSEINPFWSYTLEMTE